jgi:type IV pilus assembly protein PilY1
MPDGPYGTCARKGTYGTTGGAGDALPAVAGWSPRTVVRKWAPSACTDGVPGRSVSIVRIEDGLILHTFGRVNTTLGQHDIPSAMCTTSPTALCTDVAFDSPMTGVPVVYPGQVGAAMTKFFVGDADGTIWRFDTSDTDPKNWKAEMFFDTYTDNGGTGQGIAGALVAPNAALGVSVAVPSTATDFANISQPIQLAPVLSIDLTGNLIMHVATGDQDTFSPTTFSPGSTTTKLAAYNTLFSITERLDTGTSKLRADVNWYLAFNNGERVTGPMAVFDKNFYFATYQPITAAGTSVCSNGEARIWGADFNTVLSGCAVGSPAKGCITPLTFSPFSSNPFYVPGASDPTVAGQVIPGVVLQIQAPCSTTSSATDSFAGGSYTQFTSYGNATPSLGYLTNKLNGGSTNTTAQATNLALPAPKYATQIDSWAAIVE